MYILFAILAFPLTILLSLLHIPTWLCVSISAIAMIISWVVLYTRQLAVEAKQVKCRACEERFHDAIKIKSKTPE